MTFGGVNFAKKVKSDEAFLVTLRHDENVAYVASVPNAKLPAPQTFRGNTNIRLGDDRYAFVGTQAIYGINELDKAD